MAAAFPYFIFALVLITLIDSLGAIASRVFNFNYGYLSAVSFIVYGLVGYYIAPVSGLNIAILASLAIGFYDATIGMKLSLLCKANLGEFKEQVENTSTSFMLTVMLFIAPLLAFIGYLFT